MPANTNNSQAEQVPLRDITACPGCDVVVATKPVSVPFGSHLLCPRCRHTINDPRRNTVDRTLALSLTGLLVFIPAHFMLLLQFDAMGLVDQATVVDSMTAVMEQQYLFVGIMILLSAIIVPLVKLTLLCGVSLGLRLKKFPRRLPFMFRWYCHLEEWGMTEVYLIGILVTIIKMSHMAEISYEKGFTAFLILTAALVGTAFTLDRHYYWNKIEELNHAPGKPANDASGPTARAVPGQPALAANLIQCHTCHKLLPFRDPEPGHELTCPRCGATVHKRKPGALTVTWALVITAAILSLPANLLPIMEVSFLGTPDRSTIMDGIIYFFQTGSYGIGLVILTASILVPLFKIVGLVLLLYSIQFNRWSHLTQKSIMFRFIEFIGRWSMLDIFVIALLCALVDFGFFTTITAAPAATFFTLVVLCTMFAAISFDPRLMWDIVNSNESRNRTLNP